ncbi:hypothetical protein BDV10DRAFT_168131 [Aspergillus recurvatus]
MIIVRARPPPRTGLNTQYISPWNRCTHARMLDSSRAGADSRPIPDSLYWTLAFSPGREPCTEHMVAICRAFGLLNWSSIK